MDARKLALAALALCLAALGTQLVNHATQRSAVGTVLAGHLPDVELVGLDGMKAAVSHDLRGLDLFLDPEDIVVRRDGDQVTVEVSYDRMLSLGPLEWKRHFTVRRDTVLLGI